MPGAERAARPGGGRAARRPRYAEHRQASAARSRVGVLVPMPERVGARGVRGRSAQRTVTRSAGSRGRCRHARRVQRPPDRTATPTTPRPSTCEPDPRDGGRSRGGRAAVARRTTRSAPSGRASTPTTTRRTTATTSRSSTSAPRRSIEITADRHPHQRRRVRRRRRSCSPPGSTP